MVEASLTGAPIETGKGSKKGGKAVANGSSASGGLSKNGTLLKDFRLEYAKSGASKCGACEEKIKKVIIFSQGSDSSKTLSRNFVKKCMIEFAQFPHCKQFAFNFLIFRPLKVYHYFF